MIDWSASLNGLAVIAATAALLWLTSLLKRDVSIVDSAWSLLFLLALLTYLATSDTLGSRALLVLALVTLWAVRLSVHITRRNHGNGEDRRYQAMRRNNDPGFAWKSLYLVFGLQGLLAWLIAMPLFAAASGATPVGALDYAGLALWVTGMFFEVTGDWQLARFKAQPANRGKVMDRGLWRYTRHPNYFGECCLWWGYYLLAAAAGGWWTLLSPVLMTFLLLKVSGVALLEQDIGTRRPAYRDYVRRTNAFIPGLPRRTGEQRSQPEVRS
jgi:steroid 5-alpha reductase family enzyme